MQAQPFTGHVSELGWELCAGHHPVCQILFYKRLLHSASGKGQPLFPPKKKEKKRCIFVYFLSFVLCKGENQISNYRNRQAALTKSGNKM